MRWCQNGDFLRPVFPASRTQRISDLHFKFALGPHHVWYLRPLRLGEKKRKKKERRR